VAQGDGSRHLISSAIPATTAAATNNRRHVQGRNPGPPMRCQTRETPGVGVPGKATTSLHRHSSARVHSAECWGSAAVRLRERE
jgi:hypothetical protein